MAHWTLPKDEQVNVQVTFAFDSAVLADSQKPMLRHGLQRGRRRPGSGCCGSSGTPTRPGSAGYNQKLSVLRAEEVERFFVNDCGIAPDRLQAVGVGEQFPFDDRDPLAGGEPAGGVPGDQLTPAACGRERFAREVTVSLGESFDA